MQLTTRKKIRLASLLAKGILFIRKLAGCPPVSVFRRGGVKWELDLREGIDFAIFLLGGFERATQKAYGKLIKPGDIVLDVGANIGAHTLPLARCVQPDGKVYAFEATQYAVAKLKQNLDLNMDLLNTVQVQHALLTDGIEQINIEAIHSSWPLTAELDKGHPQHGGHLKQTETSEQYSIDQFIRRQNLERVDFVKLDVDGFEWPILQGMRLLVAQFRPTFIMELAPDYSGVSLKRILTYFWEYDYDFYSLCGKTRFPQAEPEIRRLIPKGGSINATVRWSQSPQRQNG